MSVIESSLKNFLRHRVSLFIQEASFGYALARVACSLRGFHSLRNLWRVIRAARQGVNSAVLTALSALILMGLLLLAEMLAPCASDAIRRTFDVLSRPELDADPPGGKTDRYIPIC